ncbi:hypothetical protein [Longimicrobium sp.]|uniref:hypothetical protein n=1 Tax=Longimicrobium sp. TaxID=2029185 RepID=UPI002C5D3BFD|nr:hypothetical protein [Longimicrobium sp.]HSU12468.1 hypothetical protein [Longimicrobium sp.]
MQHRSRSIFTIAATAVLFATIAACDEPTLTGGAGGTARTELAPEGDRALYRSGDELALDADRRAGMLTADLARLEEQQGYPSLRAYLDPDATEETARASGDSEEPTGNEAVALQKDGVTRGDFNVADGILSLLNSRGEIQVGDTVYKVTRDNAYAVNVRDLAVLREKVPTLSSPAPADGDPRIVVEPIKTTEMPGGDKPAASRSGDPAGMASIGAATSSCLWQSGSNRMHGKTYITSFWFYSEAGIRTDWEHRHSFLWWSWWSNEWQPGTLGYYYSLGGLTIGSSYVYPTSGSFVQSGTASVGKVIASGWFKSIRGAIYGTHWSPIGTCYTAVYM